MMKHVGSTIERKVIDSSSVFFYREKKSLTNSKGSYEILLGKRRENLSAFPDLWSGIGGKVSKVDFNYLKNHSENKNIDLLKICAVREVIEEAGLILLTKGIKQISPAKKIDLEELNYGVDDYNWNNIIPAGLKETPEFTLVNPIFKTQYFLYKVSQELNLEITEDNEEFAAIAWKTPQEWIDGFENQEVKIPPPVIGLLRFFLPNTTPQEAAQLSEQQNTKPIGLQTRVEMHPGIFVVPLKSQTIPPATTTNCFILGDAEHRYIVDPGSHLKDEKKRIVQVVTELAEKNSLQGILLTHHHKDHWQSVGYVQKELAVPVLAHHKSKQLVEQAGADFIIDKTLQHGNVIDLGKDAKNRPWELEVVFTGGHSQDHIAFLDRRFNALVAGDMVAGIGTVLVENMGEYLKSLDLLIDKKIGIIAPGHGTMHYNGQKILQQYKEHRLQRLQLILDAFSKYGNKATIAELTELAYNDVVKEYHQVAKLQVQTYLRYLEEKKEVIQEGEKFRKVN